MSERTRMTLGSLGNPGLQGVPQTPGSRVSAHTGRHSGSLLTCPSRAPSRAPSGGSQADLSLGRDC